ncbi:MAG: putative anaerobic dehydrogenase [Haloquadratum walsbyi J07HQW2]|uniref:Putative anaerobic dehydrogenase n=2 Tax=Haloquadratum walsbyi TaxID=293091 RepID=U1PQ33_9EURY|nr:MAG: putative anaerobic dehydrogenase [Haloquadratum walsbyi J07HQW2]
MRCAVGCGHITERTDSGYGIDSVRGDIAHPASRGQACARGINETQNPDGDRLTQPHVRRNGSLQSTTWDVALSEAVSAFSETLSRTRDGVAVLGSGQQTNEAAYALGKVARGGFGTQYYDANTTLCMASAVTAYFDAFGNDAPPPTYDDIDDAKTHLVWGANPAVAHPVMFRWINSSADVDDSRLIVVDPVKTQTAAKGDEHISPAPGTDLALARAVIARVIERGDIDDTFIQQATTGFETLTEALPDVGDAAATAGVSVSTVDRLAAALADKTLLYWGMGVNQSTQGTATAGALIDLCLATGNMGPGSGPFSLTGQANSMGARVCSSKGTWPGMRSFTDPIERQTIADAWDIPPERLPDTSGPGPVETITAIADGPVETVWTVATNPAAGLPNASTAKSRLSDAFLIVQDAFHTETTELADIVLPAATWGETDGTATNMERRVSRVRSASALKPMVRTDLDIITTIGGSIAPGLFETTTPSAIFDELAALTAGTPADLSGISYERLDDERAVRWPAPSAVSQGSYQYYADGTWDFETPSGRARFSTATHAGVPEPIDESYPLTLTTGREPDGYNTGIRSRDVDAESHPVARVNPRTADTLSANSASHESQELEPGALAQISSRRATVTVELALDTDIPTGMVWLSIHHPETNTLTLPATDPRSNEPNLKQCAVAIKPVMSEYAEHPPTSSALDD